jgi:MFS family permease
MPHTPDLAESAKPPHPAFFGILIIPFGAVSGYVSVAIAYLCTQNKLTVEDGALLVASGMFPHVWKFAWAPIADTTLTRKRWYMLSATLCALGTIAMSAIPLARENLHLLQAVIFVTNLASTFLGMSVEGLMAHVTTPDRRGRVAGWFQAGNLGGSGLGGGAGLEMATHWPSPWMSGAVLAVAYMLGALVLLRLPEVPAERRDQSLPGALWGVIVDLWRMVKTAAGIICITLCLAPMNTGAATNVLSQAEVAQKWNADEHTVALVGGVLNGVISILGCLAGGEACHRINARKVYAAVALGVAATSVAMAFAPFTRTNYITLSLIYAFVVGMSYAAFTGFVLDAIGKGAIATKMTSFASLSNFPIMYMGLVLAWVQTRWTEKAVSMGTSAAESHLGEKAMLLADAGAGVLGLLFLAVVVSIVRLARPRAVTSPA